MHLSSIWNIFFLISDWNEDTENKVAKKASRTDTQTAEKPEKSPTFWNKRNISQNIII